MATLTRISKKARMIKTKTSDRILKVLYRNKTNETVFRQNPIILIKLNNFINSKLAR